LPRKAPLFTRKQLLAFSTGKPSEAFGEPYRIFDKERIIARLPAPPYAFMDRVTAIEPRPWVLEPGGWVTAEYEVPPDAWYFKADRSGSMAYCVLLEIALQPCGWLAAYAGSALRSASDLKFRNLGGEGRLHRSVLPHSGTLTMRTRMTKVSEAGNMIIENFEFQVLDAQGPIYTGTTYFGFFTAEALSDQVGLKEVDGALFTPRAGESAQGWSLGDEAPLTPYEALRPEAKTDALPISHPQLCLPGKALRMVDRIEAYEPTGGPHGLGLILGSKTVDPEEWFFKAHFYQDPVCPGSLGVESFIQLMKVVAMDRWPELNTSHRFEVVTDPVHRWSYRGQILPTNRTVSIATVVTRIERGESPTLYADGLLSVDGLKIYHMENFGLRLLPR
jgi:3-hydroxymyristoyl/3-hydroxydecanoyl-(acyl carrier protein) dehydratase